MDEFYENGDSWDGEAPDADLRPKWSDRLDDFLIYMGKATIIKSGLLLAIMIPLGVHQWNRAEEHKAQEARRQLDQQVRQLEQDVRERALSGNVLDVELQLLGISPEEYAPLRAQRGDQAPQAEQGRDEAPPPRLDF